MTTKQLHQWEANIGMDFSLEKKKLAPLEFSVQPVSISVVHKVPSSLCFSDLRREPWKSCNFVSLVSIIYFLNLLNIPPLSRKECFSSE